MVSLFASGVDLSFIKALRILRVLRPLRVISRNEGLKVAVQCLFNAIPGIVNVLVIAMLFFMLFGIFGTNYFKGTFFYCDTRKVPMELTSIISNKWECIDYGGVWVNQDANFDNVFNSMLTLFKMSTTEGWVGTMWNGVDSVAIDRQPQEKRNIYWVFFFMAFIIVGSQFLMNLFVGVVINSFNYEREKLGKNHLLSDRQREWIRI